MAQVEYVMAAPGQIPSAVPVQVVAAKPQHSGGAKALVWILVLGGAALIGYAAYQQYVKNKNKSTTNPAPSPSPSPSPSAAPYVPPAPLVECVALKAGDSCLCTDVYPGPEKECANPTRMTSIPGCGYSSMTRGWYDMYNTGARNDFCRFIGDASSSTNPLRFSCLMNNREVIFPNAVQSLPHDPVDTTVTKCLW